MLRMGALSLLPRSGLFTQREKGFEIWPIFKNNVGHLGEQRKQRQHNRQATAVSTENGHRKRTRTCKEEAPCHDWSWSRMGTCIKGQPYNRMTDSLKSSKKNLLRMFQTGTSLVGCLSSAQGPKPGVVVHSCEIPETHPQEDWKLEVILGYVLSLRPGWTT